jgi:hypothetical protein
MQDHARYFGLEVPVHCHTVIDAAAGTSANAAAGEIDANADAAAVADALTAAAADVPADS